MTTVQDMIKLALQELEVYEPGDTLTPEDLLLGRTRLQFMLDSWSIDGLMIPLTLKLVHTVTAPTMEYTIGKSGSAADLTAEIVTLKQVDLVRQQSLDRIVLDRASQPWLSTTNMPDSSYGPGFFHFESSVPLSYLKFNAPMQPMDTFTLYYEGYLVDENLQDDTELVLPRGYHKTVLLSLAKELQSSYGKNLSRVALKEQKDGKTRIKLRNVQPTGTRLDPSLPGRRHTNYLYGR